ncbi:MAG: triose-phosphate isomerase [Rickettsiales bacterium]
MSKLIVANWKMNGNIEFTKKWSGVVCLHIGKKKSKDNTKVVVCPPDGLIFPLKGFIDGSAISVGGQDCYVKDEGAYTGETSVNLLKDLGCEYVIVGHSERRSYFDESDNMVSQKAAIAIKSGIIPIICVGETAEERNNGKTEEVLRNQVNGSFPYEMVTDSGVGKFIFAYEPVWAIGTGKVPTISDIKEAHNVIKREFISNITTNYQVDAQEVGVLYGGSVKPENSSDIMTLDEVAGVLVGGASLRSDDFCKIIDAAG